MPFTRITGHRPVVDLLRRAVARQTLPQSLIFAGPDGVGKRLTAMALAQALNCERVTDGNACGECAACARIARGVHADLVLIEPGDTGVIKVDQIREAIERTGYRPFEGRRRVVIIEQADALQSEAQNALLKTLEEPPPASVFVLVTSRPDVLLPTVRSRCQRLRFGPLSAVDVAGVLVRDHGFTPADAQAAAAASDGSVGGALDEGADDVLEAREAAAKLLQGVAVSSDPRRRLDGAKAILAGIAPDDVRDELSRRLLALSSLLRDLGVLGAEVDERLLANQDLKPQLQALRRSYDPERTIAAFSAVDRALNALDRNASPKIVADWIAFNL
jgi:DNA polymerase-3 subunit delta'